MTPDPFKYDNQPAAAGVGRVRLEQLPPLAHAHAPTGASS